MAYIMKTHCEELYRRTSRTFDFNSPLSADFGEQIYPNESRCRQETAQMSRGQAVSLVFFTDSFRLRANGWYITGKPVQVRSDLWRSITIASCIPPSDPATTPRFNVIDPEIPEEPGGNRGQSVTSIASAISRSKISSEGTPFVRTPGGRELSSNPYVRSTYFDSPEPIYIFWEV